MVTISKKIYSIIHNNITSSYNCKGDSSSPPTPTVVVVVGVQAGDAAPGDVKRRQVGGEEAVFVWK